MKPINPVLIEKRDNIDKEIAKLYAERNPLNDAIMDRISYIVDRTIDQCGWECEDWHTVGRGKGIVNMDLFIKPAFLNMSSIFFANRRAIMDDPIMLLRIDGRKFNIFCKLPRKWLFEDFQNELQVGIENQRKYEERQNKIADRAIAKLTDQERRALYL